jgi:mono/diheme cytochrome c family protein
MTVPTGGIQMKRIFRTLTVLGSVLFLQPALLLQAQAANPLELFEKNVRPLLAENCFGCHGESARGGLRLDTPDGILKGGKSGPAIVPGDPDKSLLVTAVKQTGMLKMPLGGSRLTDAQIADISAWIKDGAPQPSQTAMVAGGAKPDSVREEFFENHIRPLLAQQCFACHTNSKSGGLRLDSRDDVLKGGGSGPAVVPGDPDKSLLLAAIKHSGTLKMPKSGTRLTDAQIDDVAMWIKDGAYWPSDKTAKKEYTAEQKHLWSIQPLQHPAPPKVKDTAWPVNDIDRFVLAKLEKEGLKPASTADRRTLLRRVTYDLTGLMPAYDEVKAFENDKSPNAWEKVVDRLLASPQYGEKWARHWMDVVRYGEDDYRVGKQPDRAEKYTFAYLYRDWLIRSLNDDIPYDMFVKAQVAADLLDEKIRDKYIPALGMNGNGIWIFHASPAPIERADEWHDKVDVTTKAFLGLTVGCARCHDHKYDAIYSRDYYQVASIFASSQFKAYPRVPQSVVDEYEKQNKVLERKNADLKKFQDDASALYAQVLFAETEDYMMAAWKLSTQKRSTVESIAEETKVDPEILDRWVRFLKKKPDNYSALKAWQEMVARNGKEDEARRLAHEFYLKVSDLNQKYLKLDKENEMTLAQSKDKDDPYDPLPNGLKRQLNRYQIDLKSMDREDTLLWKDVFDQDVPDATAEVVQDDGGPRRKPGLLKLTDGALERRLSAELKAHIDHARADIDAFKKSMPAQYPFVYGIADAPQPSDLKVFSRGNPYTFGEDAPRAFPSIFNNGQPMLFDKGSGRLQFAEEVVRQPITARTIVNRIWGWNMGRGIIDTPSNLGMAGDRPSNPELLEYLASKFQADGMSWKKLTKEILMSRTYQLSAQSVESNLAKDADNRFFWRANRQRLDSEGVWDGLLEASGALDLKGIGGPSEDLSEKMTRRGVYAKVSRLYPSDFQATFDLPTATISAEKRFITNVPQQRLFFLNNSFVQKQAEMLVDRVKPAGDLDAQVKLAFEIVYQRMPTPDELTASMEFVKLPVQETAPASDVAAPDPAAADTKGKGRRGAKDDAQDAPKKLKDSPFRSFCWALLSSNEFLYMD